MDSQGGSRGKGRMDKHQPLGHLVTFTGKIEKSAGICRFSSPIPPPQITRIKWIEMDRNGRYPFRIPEKHSVSVISVPSVVQTNIHKEVGEVHGGEFQ